VRNLSFFILFSILISCSSGVKYFRYGELRVYHSSHTKGRLFASFFEYRDRLETPSLAETRCLAILAIFNIQSLLWSNIKTCLDHVNRECCDWLYSDLLDIPPSNMLMAKSNIGRNLSLGMTISMIFSVNSRGTLPATNRRYIKANTAAFSFLAFLRRLVFPIVFWFSIDMMTRPRRCAALVYKKMFVCGRRFKESFPLESQFHEEEERLTRTFNKKRFVCGRRFKESFPIKYIHPD